MIGPGKNYRSRTLLSVEFATKAGDFGLAGILLLLVPKGVSL
jgi:hypothetical protein